MVDQETRERYEKVALTRVCPDCGEDVVKTTLRETVDKTGVIMEDDEDPDAIAYMCSHAECKYVISLGEKEKA